MVTKRTFMSTDAFIRYNEKLIQREEIRALCEPKKAAEIRKGIEGRKRLLDAFTKNIGNRGFETCAFTDSFTMM